MLRCLVHALYVLPGHLLSRLEVPLLLLLLQTQRLQQPLLLHQVLPQTLSLLQVVLLRLLQLEFLYFNLKLPRIAATFTSASPFLTSLCPLSIVSLRSSGSWCLRCAIGWLSTPSCSVIGCVVSFQRGTG